MTVRKQIFSLGSGAQLSGGVFAWNGQDPEIQSQGNLIFFQITNNY